MDKTYTLNNTFSFSRFGKYFQYDCRRWVAGYGPTLLLMSAFPVILYTMTLVYSLLFRQEWGTPGETTRIIVACIMTGILMLTYPSQVYGFVTDKRAGSAFLMIPASVFEKFLSMILNTALVVPLAFGSVYLALDAVICAVDGTCGGTLFSSLVDGLKVLASFAFSSDAPVKVSMFSMCMNAMLGCLYFLLGALLFRKHKILYPILILVGFNMVVSMIFGLVLTMGVLDMDALSEWMEHFVMRYVEDPDFIRWAVPVYNAAATLWDLILTGGLMAAVYFRIRTLKH